MSKPLDSTELAQRIDAVDYDIYRTWHTSGQPPLAFTFRFEDAPAPDFPWTDVSNFSGWTESKRETVRDALAIYETILNLTFTEDNSAADSDFAFYLASSGLSGGRGRFRYNGSEWDGSAVFNAARALNSNDMGLVVHEIGHTLGLKHTGNYDVGGNLPPPPFLPAEEDNTRFSIMSYNDAPGLYDITSPSLYDIAALQARFGANMSHATGKDTYTTPGNSTLRTIWDAGGFDRITAAGSAGAAQIDLRAGTFSTFADRGEIAIAYGTRIEMAVGGKGDDSLTGNEFTNRMVGGLGNDRVKAGAGDDIVFGGAGNDRLFGGGGKDRIEDGAGRDVVRGGDGADRFFAQDGNDRISGDGGFDTYVAGGRQARFEVTDLGNGVWTVSDGTFTDRLTGIERIVFTDDTILL